MPKVHNIGPIFVQLTNFPYEWEGKWHTRGWTQEITEPFRVSNPIILRLPNYKALVLGRWTGKKETEDEAITTALDLRWATEDDFTEEAGWTPAPDSHGEESLDDLYARFGYVDGAVDVHDWKAHYFLAKESD